MPVERVVWRTFDPSPAQDVDGLARTDRSLLQRINDLLIEFENLWVTSVVDYDAREQAQLFGVDNERADQGIAALLFDEIGWDAERVFGTGGAWIRVLVSAAFAIIGITLLGLTLRNLVGRRPRKAVERGRVASRDAQRIDRALKRLGAPRPAHRPLLDHAPALTPDARDALVDVARVHYAVRFGGADRRTADDAIAALERIARAHTGAMRSRAAMTDEPVDALMPLDPDEHRAQLVGLAELLPERARVVDVGAGLGRVAIPLAESGRDVYAIDTEEAYLVGLESATADLPTPVRTRRADALDHDADLAHPAGPTDAALILGNTLALFEDTRACADMLIRLRATLAPTGVILIDHLHTFVWREVREGYWQEGVSEDGAMQLVWRDGDAVIAVREGDAVDASDDALRAHDTPMRLWSWGALHLLARCAGFSDPEARPAHHLVVLRPS